MPRFFDISPPVSEQIAVWPGDVAYSRQVSCAIEAGSNIDLSSHTTTVHVGAHADAPSHYVAGGADISQRDLSYYYGPCQVIAVAVERGARIVPADLPGPISAPRVVLRTGSFPDPENWNDDFASLSPELVDHLHAAGVVLVGIDTPSVDPMHDKLLESHQALARNDMANLEGLVLTDVPPGVYTLSAFPLPLVGADASPVRAVLIRAD